MTLRDNDSSKKNQLYLVGIGASAGGLEAISNLLSSISDRLQDAAIIIAQHLSPTYKSMLTQLLSRETNLRVVEIKDRMKISNRTIYITPPDSETTVKGSTIYLNKPSTHVGPKPSIDRLFTSIAENYQENAIGIILSGTGSDGANGIRAIKLNRGICIAQEPQNAKYDGMPIAAIETGVVDFISTTDKIAEELIQISQGNKTYEKPFNQGVIENGNGLSKVYRLLSKRTGTDFSNYKQSTLGRRLEKRLSLVNVKNVDEYIKLIEKTPNELDLLLQTVLIGVTTFFRDKEAFSKLESHLKEIIAQKKKNESIRIWIPGCATGEEPYSIAILLSKILRENINDYKIQIFGTDIDEKAVAIARRGIFAAKSLESVDPEIVENYFLKRKKEYELIKSIRSMVLFSKHDVISNPPFLKLDLISCRNLLIYFGQNLQTQVFPLFHYALNESGMLFLGKSETIGHFTHLFKTIDKRYKIFKKKWTNNNEHLSFAFKTNNSINKTSVRNPMTKRNFQDFVKDAIYDHFDYPYVIINEHFEIKEIKGEVRNFLSLTEGAMNLNIIRMAHPTLQIELRRYINSAIKEEKVIRSKIKKYDLYDHAVYLRVIVKPIKIEDISEFYMVVFEKLEIDKSLEHTIYPDSNSQIDFESARIKELEHELEVNKENLQTYIEEVETSNEELQSLNEELQSTNEELQSSNEELETSNEELHSTNEEIQIAYGELKAANETLEKKDKLLMESESNVFGLLNNTLHSSILIDKELKIIVFNDKAAETIKKLTAKSLKTNALFIDYLPALELENFHADFNKALKGKDIIVTKMFTSHRNLKHWFMLSYTPVSNEKNSVNRISFSMLEITSEVKLKNDLLNSENLIKSVFNSASVGICVTDKSGKIIKVNKEYCKLFHYSESELIGKEFTLVFPIEKRDSFKKVYQNRLIQKTKLEEEVSLQRRDGSMVDVFMSSVPLVKSDGNNLMVTSLRDISESKKFRELLIETQESVKIGGWELDLFTHENTWTDEVYQIYDVDKDFDVNVENGLKFYEGNAVERLEDALKNAIEKGEHYDLELPFISAKNNRKWVRVTCKPIRVEHRTIKLYGTIQDITSRKRHEEKLIRITKAIDNASDAIRIASADGNILYFNKSYQQLLGFETIEEVNQNGGIFGFYENQEIGKRITEQVKNGISWKGEVNLIRKNGKKIPVSLKSEAIRDEDGTIIGILGILNNISSKIKHQEYLALMESVVVNSNDGVMITESKDPGDGAKIIYVNDAFCKMTGYAKDEIIGVTHRILHGPKTDRNELTKVRKALSKKQPGHAEVVNYRKDGSEFWVDFSVVPIFNEKGNITKHVSIQRDVTDRKNSEEELKLRYHEIEKTNAELDKFVYSASHDLRAPLASVLGLINLVKMDEKEVHHIEYLNNMQKSIRKLDGFISEIINYSRNTRLDIQPEEIELNQLVSEIKEDHGYMENADKIKINIHPETEFKFYSDRARLRVILNNLISNAMKYHNLRREHPYIKVSGSRKDDMIIIAIEDNGPGIDKKYQEKIFDMFYRGSENSSGSGLGLYIVKETLAKLEGIISLQSHLGEGSTFKIAIPDLTNGE